MKSSESSIRHNWIKPPLFLAVGLVLILFVTRLLQSPKGSVWAVQTGMGLIHSEKNRFDVLEAGTSTVIANISNQELYERYGITGVSVGEPQQPLYLTKYTLEDALQYQTPQVVLLDSKAFFYSEEWIENKATNEADFILHNSIDPLRKSSTKRKAVTQAKEYASDLDEWDYFSSLYYNHRNWKEISQSRWRNYTASDYMNGNLVLFSMTDKTGVPYNESAEVTDDEEQISESALKEIREIHKLCTTYGTDLILITGYITSTKAQHNATQKIADQLGIPYIDINEISGTIGFHNNVDVADGDNYAHFNLLGTIKWTDYLGDYLSSHYQFDDKREAGGIRRFEQQKAVFARQKTYMEEHLSLEQALDFQSYLQALSGLNPEKYAIFLSVYDEGTVGMTETNYSLLHQLGLVQYDQLSIRENYVAVISSEGIQEQHSKKTPAKLEGKLDQLDYQISSGGFNHADAAGIVLSGAECMQKGRGLNVVVYDRMQRRVINSVFFDTYEMENPPKQRFTTVTNTSSVIVRQSAVGVQQWTDVY